MANKVGIVGTVLGLGALGVGVVVLHQNDSLQKEVVKIKSAQVKNTRDLGDEATLWREKFKGESKVRMELHQAFENYKNDVSEKSKSNQTVLDSQKVELDAAKLALGNLTGRIGGLETASKETTVLVGKLATKDELETTKSTIGNLNGKIGSLEGSYRDSFDKIAGLETASKETSTLVSKLDSKVSTFKTDEEKRIAALRKAIPNVVGLNIYDERGNPAGSLMGFIVKDKKGEYFIATAGHGWSNQEAFLNSTVDISFINGLSITDLSPTKFSGDITPWSGPSGRDFAVIRIPAHIQPALQKSRFSGLSVASASTPLKPGAGLNLVESGWRVTSGTVSNARPHWRGWTMRRDIVTDALIKQGDSGGVAVDNEGNLMGMLVERKEPKARIVLNNGQPVANLKVEVGDANTGHNFMVGYLDIQRSLRSYGINDFDDEDRTLLTKQDILVDRKYMLAPPLPGPNLTGGLLPFIYELSQLDGYVFREPEPALKK